MFKSNLILVVSAPHWNQFAVAVRCTQFIYFVICSDLQTVSVLMKLETKEIITRNGGDIKTLTSDPLIRPYHPSTDNFHHPSTVMVWSKVSSSEGSCIYPVGWLWNISDAVSHVSLGYSTGDLGRHISYPSSSSRCLVVTHDRDACRYSLMQSMIRQLEKINPHPGKLP